MTDDDLTGVFCDPSPYAEPPKPRRSYRRHTVEPVAQAGTWRPDGGPEMNRYSGELTPAILSRFRAHTVCGGMQKRPDQPKGQSTGEWWQPGPRHVGEAYLRGQIARLRPMVADQALFSRLMVDSGKCGAAKWVIDGKWITSSSLWAAFYACRILELTAGRDVQSVVDLGGGYGHLAHVLAEFFPSVTLVDLPIPLALAREWSANHPATADKVTLRHPYEEWGAVDLLINTHSFQHMTPDNLAFYDAKIRENPPRLMYSMNRRTVRDETDTVFHNYPWLPLYSTVSERRIRKHIEWFGEH